MLQMYLCSYQNRQHLLLPNFFSQMNTFIMNSEVISTAKTFPTFFTLVCFFTFKGKIQYILVKPSGTYDYDSWTVNNKQTGSISNSSIPSLIFIPKDYLLSKNKVQKVGYFYQSKDFYHFLFMSITDLILIPTNKFIFHELRDTSPDSHCTRGTNK